MKFPSQNKLQYAQAAAVSNDAWTQFTTRNAADDGTVAGHLNICKDLSILNRRGYCATDRKGVPWVYRCGITLFLQDEDGFGLNAAVGSDFCTTLKIDGVQNNWVAKNAAVKYHAAREAMFKKAGVKKSHRGAYAHEIRYNYDGVDDAWIQPIDGSGNPFTGGTWDSTTLSTEDDTDFQLRLVGNGVDESGAFSATAINLLHSYLCSRATVAADSNLEVNVTPTEFSILGDMLSDYPSFNVRDDVIDIAQDEQDNPPYDEFGAGSDLQHDVTEAVELGRAIAGLGSTIGYVVVDIPFGIADLRLTHFDAADTSITSEPNIMVEVLAISPMQG